MAVNKAKSPKTQRKRVYYTKESTHFQIVTLNPEVAKTLDSFGIPVSYNKKQGCFISKCETLPSIPQYIFTEHKPKKADLKERGKIERLFKKKLKMEETLSKMQDEIESVESELITALIKNGLKLKPSAQKDSQLFIRNTNYKVHYRECIRKVFDLDQVFNLRTNFPILEKAIRRRDDEYVDKRILVEILEELPARVSSKIINFERMCHLHEPELNDPECVHCGGKLKRDGYCKNCKLDQKLS